MPDRNVKPHPAVVCLVLQVKHGSLHWVAAWLSASRLPVPGRHALLVERWGGCPSGDETADSFANPTMPSDNAASSLASAAVVTLLVKGQPTKNARCCLQLASGCCCCELPLCALSPFAAKSLPQRSGPVSVFDGARRLRRKVQEASAARPSSTAYLSLLLLWQRPQ